MAGKKIGEASTIALQPKVTMVPPPPIKMVAVPPRKKR
jgi:hypothetical protein